MNHSILGEAALEREAQRSESEARDIIHELDKLNTLSEERKTRWVWELLQNAKDVAGSCGVDITFKLTSDELVFSHNGLPFETKHLLAILYKTSTKSLEGEDGTTGKYGTGFVTTHILNKKLKIRGVHKNTLGTRNFELEINRSVISTNEDEALSEMQRILANTFIEIDAIAQRTSEEINSNQHSFSYKLTPSSYIYAENGLLELERNIAFTLLINQEYPKRINSLSIEKDGKRQQYFADPKPTFIEGVQFISSNKESGLLFYSSDKLTIGIPAKEINGSYQLLPIENQAVIFKEFPLIGTENFNLPVFIQHRDFHPTELRNGIRTKKATDEKDDPIADKNREAFIGFVNAYLSFIEKLINAKLENIHLFAESGLPEFVKDFSNSQWYQDNIQKPIRNFILEHNVVKTCSDNLIKISQARFLKSKSDKDESLYSLVSELIPDQIPNKCSIWQWVEIIAQNPESWAENLTIDENYILEILPKSINLAEPSSIKWLEKLYEYLDINNLGSNLVKLS